MKITINAIGSRGDVQPYVALAVGLAEAGHEVLVATHRLFEELVLKHGLALFPIEQDPRDILISKAVADIGGNPIRINRWIADNFRPHLREVFLLTLAAAQNADLLVNSALSIAGYHVAEKLGSRAIGAYLQPVTPTREFATFSTGPLPRWLPFNGLYNYYATKLSNQMFFNMTRKLVNECRAEILDLPSLGASYYWRVDSASWSVPLIYGFSPSVIPRPADWGVNQKIAGYWFLDGIEAYAPPVDLIEFIDSGPPPVSIGFGSMVDHQRETLTQLVVEAVEKAGVRAVLLTGWSDLGNYQLPDTILPIEFAPHEWLFPRMSAVIHHGGAGTTAAGLRAGTPSVVVPFFADQPFWGQRIYELGAGPKPIPRKKLTAEKLATAIKKAIGDEQIRRYAGELGVSIRA
ncbi:MAG: glycosyltransferase, partial [Candidatus Promineifilaceae bacterium]